MFGRIDILVLCAGISLHETFEEQKNMENFKKMMKTNFFGYVNLTMPALPHVRKSKGQIIVINSISGLVGLPFRTSYCASKFAVKGFFESLAVEESEINILNVYPTTMIGTSLRQIDEKDVKADSWKFYPADKMADNIL